MDPNDKTNDKENPKQSQIRYTNLPIYSKHLYCSVCCNIFKDPVSLECLHTFCSECIQKVQMSKYPFCPICRNEIKGIVKDLIAGSIVEDLEVFCSYDGCSWRGKRKSLPGHMTSCDFEKSLLMSGIKPSVKCEYDYEAAEVVNHVNINTRVGLKERLYSRVNNKSSFLKYVSRKKKSESSTNGLAETMENKNEKHILKKNSNGKKNNRKYDDLELLDEFL